MVVILVSLTVAVLVLLAGLLSYLQCYRLRQKTTKGSREYGSLSYLRNNCSTIKSTKSTEILMIDFSLDWRLRGRL